MTYITKKIIKNELYFLIFFLTKNTSDLFNLKIFEYICVLPFSIISDKKFYLFIKSTSINRFIYLFFLLNIKLILSIEQNKIKFDIIKIEHL